MTDWRAYLPEIGLDGPWIGLLGGPPVDVSGQVTLDEQGFAIDALEFQAGESLIQGDLVYRAPQSVGGVGSRPISAPMVSIWPTCRRSMPSHKLPRRPILVVAVAADDVRYGEGRPAGRIRARLPQ